MEKIVLYTVLLDGYDEVPPLPRSIAPEAECFLVTDDPSMEIPDGSAWQLKVVPKEDNPHRHQRRLKLRFHELFPDADTVVYLDANLHLTKALKHVLPLHRGGLTTGAHPSRRCVYQEGEACERLNKAPAAEIKLQMDAYRKEGIPPNIGMWQTGFMVRSNTPEVRDFCDAWHTELSKFTHRDQLCCTVVARRMGFSALAITWTTVQRFAKLVKHAKNSRQYANIHYLTPFAPDGNIGRAYNDAVSQVPGDNDWLVLRDGDTSFCTANWGRHIEHVLRTHGDKYQVYGAVTNRIRSPHQREEGMFDEWDLRKHWEKGEELEREKWGEVKDGGSGVAGFFMAFRKSTWKKTPFREREHTFDTLFCKDVRRAGGSIGIMSGLYIFHFYRPLSDNPVDDIKHLQIVKRSF